MKKEDKEKKEEEDGVVFEDEEEVANPNVTIKRLREKLRACEKEKIEYLTGWQKAKAEFINLRKKDEEERVDFIKFAKIDFVKDLIPILDNFENAFKSEHIMGAGKEWKNGIESIFNQIVAMLKKNGIEKHSPLGEYFDPKFHEAISTKKTKNKSEDHKIMEVFQAGYSIEGKNIRTAKVSVASYEEEI